MPDIPPTQTALLSLPSKPTSLSAAAAALLSRRQKKNAKSKKKSHLKRAALRAAAKAAQKQVRPGAVSTGEPELEEVVGSGPTHNIHLERWDM